MAVAYAALEASPACAASPRARPPERLQVHMVEAPSPEPTAPAPELASEAETPPRPAPAMERKVQRTRERKVEAASPAHAPVTVVGLTLESTSATGAGPAFAVGNSVLCSTERQASAPAAHAPSTPEPPDLPVSRNRRAAPRAAAGVSVSPARRLGRVEPEYPPLLRQQGIEADVTVRVHLTVSGSVERVELVRSSGEPAFDEAALAAARQEHFSPETHDGVPVTTALTYSYRFRITP